MDSDLLRRESHFAFGKNWESYSRLIANAQIEEAVAGIRHLTGGDLVGKRFLDIGCGSGLHGLAALRLGAREVVALDIDPDSVATTRRVLEAHAPGERWAVLERSVFDLSPDAMGRYDVVYAWGVLHHTGDMDRALRCAAALVQPGGQFIFALYARTRLCGLWKLEKRWYAKASPRSQALARWVYLTLYRLREGRRFAALVTNYKRTHRGMDLHHDVHDWLGGWPYESISPERVDVLMSQHGLRRIRTSATGGMSIGLLGSGCHEYVYER